MDTGLVSLGFVLLFDTVSVGGMTSYLLLFTTSYFLLPLATARTVIVSFSRSLFTVL